MDGPWARNLRGNCAIREGHVQFVAAVRNRVACGGRRNICQAEQEPRRHGSSHHTHLHPLAAGR